MDKKDYSQNCDFDDDSGKNDCWHCIHFLFPIGCMYGEDEDVSVMHRNVQHGGRKMINEHDAERIRHDAYIACDALQSLMLSPQLHEDYIKEKLDRVRACIEFIANFEAKDNNES